MRKIAEIVLFAAVLALVLGFSGCAVQGNSGPQDASAAEESTEPVIQVNEYVTVYTDLAEPSAKERLGTDADVSAGTVKFSGEDQKIVCRPDQDKAVVITGAEAMIDCDRTGICYKRAEDCLRFDFESNEERADPRFVVPSDAAEYKLGSDGMLREYEADGDTFFCLESDDTVRYFRQLSVQNEDYYGKDKYTMYIVEEFDSGPDNNEEQITISIDADKEKENILRVLITLPEYKRLLYVSRDEDTTIHGDECLLSSYAGLSVIARPDELFTNKFERPAFNCLTITQLDLRDINGNAIAIEWFGSDARAYKRCETNSIDYCVPTAVEGVYVIRFDFSSAVLDTIGLWPYAMATDYGVKPDDVVAYWDTRTKSRVIGCNINGRTVYYNEGSDYLLTNDTANLIPYDEYEAEQS